MVTYTGVTVVSVTDSGGVQGWRTVVKYIVTDAGGVLWWRTVVTYSGDGQWWSTGGDRGLARVIRTMASQQLTRVFNVTDE